MSLPPTPDLARIPAGDFLMGAADAEEDERPVHRVHLGEYFIGRFPVTHDEYARFVRATGYAAPAVRTLPMITFGGRDALFREMAQPYVWDHDQPPAGHGSHPVVLIRYDDALAYCAWLAEAIGRAVRLPTEAEWEKAARGGADGLKYPWGNEIDPSRGNYLADPTVKRQRGTRPTGTYAPNAFGLYDVCGNVWEWVSDWYAADYYGSGDARDPKGPSSGTMRVVRGGSWVNDEPSMLRVAYRHKVPPDTYAYSVGFRIVCVP
ncbi:MAG TPA: formylglycine-generating enzyme family protein [Vicinamibacterales bacterium]|nr:formylglycine-generating enzyme family protein [Vicinamibacterales bacterium]